MDTGGKADTPDIPAQPSLLDESSFRDLAGTSELAVTANIKTGFIDTREPISYATRLRLLLRILFAMGKNREERGEQTFFVGPIERLQNIYHVFWTVADEDSKMSMAVFFDSPLESYIRNLVDNAGSILDVILCHCEGYRGYEGSAAFTDFVKKNQVINEYFGGSIHNSTVADQDYYRSVDEIRRGAKSAEDGAVSAAKHRVENPQLVASKQTQNADPEQKFRALRQSLMALEALHQLDKYFPPASAQESASKDPKQRATAATKAQERNFYLAMVGAAIPGFTSAQVPAQLPLSLRFAHIIEWYKHQVEGLTTPTPVQTIPPEVDDVEYKNDVQGNIVGSYRRITHCVTLMLQLGSPQQGRALLAEISDLLSKASLDDSVAAEHYVYYNLALSYNGLRNLGLSETELAQFPKDFRDGMAARSGLLGDCGQNHPSHWRPPTLQAKDPSEAGEAGIQSELNLSTVDLVLQLQTRAPDSAQQGWVWDSNHPLYDAVNTLQAKAEAQGAQLLARIPVYHKRSNGMNVEHFGYKDGISQPRPLAQASHPDTVPLGEILRGHSNRFGDPVTAKGEENLLHNGSFLVIRQLRQHVDHFNKSIANAAHSHAIDSEELRAKMMGRYSDGRPLATRAPKAGENDFGFDDDLDGARCPLQSHMRRSNPRSANVIGSAGNQGIPRIARRGFLYGPDVESAPENANRGLMFMAYNASISEQFELIQRWISGGNSTGLPSDHSDPILGTIRGGRRRSMQLLNGEKVQQIDLGDQPFVSLQWGLYLFAPSLSALRQIAKMKPAAKPYRHANVGRGESLLASLTLQSGESVEANTLRWKTVMEDLNNRRNREDIWAAIDQRGGALRSHYGLLLTDETLIEHVLRDDGEHYCVAGYAERMKASIGELHLGMDPHSGPEHSSNYQREARACNRWIADFSAQRAFNDARAEAQHWLQNQLLRHEGDIYAGHIALDELVGDVLARLAALWFGLPDNPAIEVGGPLGDKANIPDDFVGVASYVFTPRPTDFVVNNARHRGTLAHQAVAKALEQRDENIPPADDTLLATLLTAEPAPLNLASTIAGAIMGFVAPTSTSLLSVLHSWIEDADLWRLQQCWRQQTLEDESLWPLAQQVLKAPLLRAMLEQPSPALLHRRAVRDGELGGQKVQVDDQIVLCIGAATLAQRRQNPAPGFERGGLLFGGDYEVAKGEKAAHACPGQSMGCAAMMGIISTLLECSGNLRTAGGLALSLNEKADLTLG